MHDNKVLKGLIRHDFLVAEHIVNVRRQNVPGNLPRCCIFQFSWESPFYAIWCLLLQVTTWTWTNALFKRKPSLECFQLRIMRRPMDYVILNYHFCLSANEVQILCYFCYYSILSICIHILHPTFVHVSVLSTPYVGKTCLLQKFC